MKLHQGVIYQHEREEHIMFTCTHFKLYCNLTCSHLQLFKGTAALHMVFIFAHAGCFVFHTIPLAWIWENLIHPHCQCTTESRIIQYSVISPKLPLLVSGTPAILVQFKFQHTVCSTKELLPIPSWKSGRASGGEKKRQGLAGEGSESFFFIIFKISMLICKLIINIWSLIWECLG